jgi:RimJ/RimL family protein N-acetyltransferase
MSSDDSRPVYARGDRVTLHPVERDDAPFLQRGHNHPDVRVPVGFTGPQSRTQAEEGIEQYIESDDNLTLLACDGGEPVGVVNARHVDRDRPTLSYWVAPEHQGEGYGTAAVGLFLDVLFRDYDVHGVTAHVFDFNDPSQSLLERLGFEREGRMREARYRRGEHVDELIYGLLRREWFEDEEA